MHRNIDGPPIIPRVLIHDRVTNVPDAAPSTPPPPPHPNRGGGLRPPLVPGTQPPMNVFFNTSGACHVPGLP
eukprot:4394267-Prymnesium_polylepis.1